MIYPKSFTGDDAYNSAYFMSAKQKLLFRQFIIQIKTIKISQNKQDRLSMKKANKDSFKDYSTRMV